ncbi:winged helix-turn-helix domain-containing protein [Agreia pratensis]|uniref:winged helix-turn-helix domain-containing protein n=1 Tax=Agreia pratensis TaxID=150121 RepID=UPI002B27BEA6|nr:helix-turn-helix domain-containing protein [Agreia pratensis]
MLSRARLLDRLHGTDRWIGGRTIDTHVKNLRAKIEDDPQNPTRLVTVYGVGYTLQAG